MTINIHNIVPYKDIAKNHVKMRGKHCFIYSVFVWKQKYFFLGFFPVAPSMYAF